MTRVMGMPQPSILGFVAGGGGVTVADAVAAPTVIRLAITPTDVTAPKIFLPSTLVPPY